MGINKTFFYASVYIFFVFILFLFTHVYASTWFTVSFPLDSLWFRQSRDVYKLSKYWCYCDRCHVPWYLYHWYDNLNTNSLSYQAITPIYWGFITHNLLIREIWCITKIINFFLFQSTLKNVLFVPPFQL